MPALNENNLFNADLKDDNAKPSANYIRTKQNHTK